MRFFGSTRALALLNVAAVGLSLSACTAAGLAQLMQIPGLASGPTTLVAGILWALCMRSPRTFGQTKLRAGWVWSIPIAMANAGVACSLYLEHGDGAWPFGLLFGPIFGVLVWAPALVLTLCCFGIPIAWSQQLAKQGLAGEERGEAIVGGVAALLAGVALVLSIDTPTAPQWWDPALFPARDHGFLYARVSAVLGGAAGLAAAVLAGRRAAQRRVFVEKVAAGEVLGFRVEATEQGRVLVRVTALNPGSGYRVSDFTEELYRLDDGDSHRTERLRS